MSTERVFHSADHFQISTGEPIRSVVTQSGEAMVIAWHVGPGQSIAAHVHPRGQDTWIILSGSGEYRLDAQGATRTLRAGDVAVAPVGCVHGVTNHGSEPLRIISVVTPADAGYALLE